MELVEGLSLEEYIRQNGRLPEDQVRKIATQLIDAMAFMHASGVYHRDVKPANVIINESSDKATLIDLGLCNHHRYTNMKRGTRCYFPPELFY